MVKYKIKFNFKKTPTKIKSLDELFDRNLVRINEIDFDGVVGNDSIL